MYKVKNIEAAPLDVDSEKRKVKIAFASLENIDNQGDAFTKSAFSKTIMERGPQGKNMIWHLLDHRASISSALSKFEEIGIEGQMVYGVSAYRDTYNWRELAWPLYEKGDITHHSVGFEVVNESKKEGYNEINEVKLYEGSAVLWPANENTPTMQVLKNLDILQDGDTPQKQVERLLKMCSKATEHELIEIGLLQLKSMLTTPPPASTEPDDALKVAMAISIFTQKLKSL